MGNFGFPVSSTEHIVKKEQGGGALLDLGCYMVLLAHMVFGPEKPQKIVASGQLFPTGK